MIKRKFGQTWEYVIRKYLEDERVDEITPLELACAFEGLSISRAAYQLMNIGWIRVPLRCGLARYINPDRM